MQARKFSVFRPLFLFNIRHYTIRVNGVARYTYVLLPIRCMSICRCDIRERVQVRKDVYDMNRHFEGLEGCFVHN